MSNNFHRISNCVWKYSVVGGVYLGACDIGEATLDNGDRVLITWGRNLTRQQSEDMVKMHGVHVGYYPDSNHDNCYELILPVDTIRYLVPVIIHNFMSGIMGDTVNHKYQPKVENTSVFSQYPVGKWKYQPSLEKGE